MKIAVFAPSAQAADYYRLLAPATVANAVQDEVEFHLAASLEDPLLERVDALMMRGLSSRSVLAPVSRLLARGVRLIVDFDSYIEPPPYHPSAGRFISYRPTPELLAGSASMVLAASDELASALVPYADKIRVVDSMVAPSPANRSQIRARLGLSDNDVLVVWGADAGKNLGIRSLQTAVQRLMASSPRVRVCMFATGGIAAGALDVASDRLMVFNRFELDDYLQVLHGCDVGIAPYEESLFDRCKPNTLVLEYAQAGLPVVISEGPIADQLRSASVPVLTASTPDTWHLHLSSLVEDSASRARLGGLMRAHSDGHPEGSRLAERFTELTREAVHD